MNRRLKALVLSVCLFNLFPLPLAWSQSPQTAPGKAEAPNKPPKVVIIGDSLTEGYGVKQSLAFPALAQEILKKSGKIVDIQNSGISGSTSASAPQRVTWALKTKPDYVVLALGANDGLRGVKPSATKENLKKAIDLIRKAGAKPLVFGMVIPKNYGEAYRKDFNQTFLDLAKEEKVPMLPFLLDKVGGDSKLNQSDGIHPNEEGHRIIAETVATFLKEHVK